MSHYLLTGATGALGSKLLAGLLDEGHNVTCLVRAQDLVTAKRRIKALVGDHRSVKTIRGDITEPRCGISDLDRDHLVGKVERILHCAASINFLDKNATQAANVAGVLHVLELADVLDAWHFMHVSSAYVVGDAPYLPEESLSIGQRWRNPYEESKYVGETMVRAWALQRDDRRFSIFRPSVLVGCEDGTTPSFDAYYGYFEPLYRVAQSFRSHRGKLPPGVSATKNGLVTLPITMVMADKVVNYIGIDWCADIIVALSQVPPKNRTYNLVHDKPLRMRDGLRWSLERLGIDGINVVATQQEKDKAIQLETPVIQRLQKRIDLVHDAYLPYCTSAPRFQMDAAREDLNGKFREPPLIDQPYLERMLDFAVEHNWGKPQIKLPELV